MQNENLRLLNHQFLASITVIFKL